MKLYSDKITVNDVREAFRLARLLNGADIHIDGERAFRARQVTIHSLAEGKRVTRRFSRGVQFYAYSLRGNRPTGHREIGSYPLDDVDRAASWDAYGYVIAHLFLADPDAVIGTYNGVTDFVRQVEQATYRREPKDFLDLVSEVCGECEARVALGTGPVSPGHEEFCSLHPSNVVAAP